MDENAELRQQLQVQAQELDRLDRLLVSGQQELAAMRDRLQRTKQAARDRLRALNEELEEEQRAREEVEEALEAAEAQLVGARFENAMTVRGAGLRTHARPHAWRTRPTPLHARVPHCRPTACRS